MKDELITLLEELGYPVFLQGSLNADEAYPPAFCTFWNDSTDGAAFYDNDAHAFVWSFSINFYATDPVLVNGIMPQLRALFRSRGWIVQGLGYDVPSDEITHSGRAIDVLYIQKAQ